MSEFIPFVVFGIVSGSIYGISAMGLVLTYKTSGVFNLAHGGVCASGAFAFYSLHQRHDVPWPIAAIIVVLVFGALVGLILERLAVVLAAAPTSYKIVGTVGLFVAIQAGVTLIYGDIALSFDPFLSQGTAFELPGVTVSYENVLTVLFGATAALALGVFFRRSRLGKAMRAVVDDPQLLDLTGTAPARVRRSAWLIGSCFAAASGVLFASNQGQVDVNVLSLLVVQAFGAATIARFQSLPMCFVGGIVVGIVQKLISKMSGSNEQLQGLDLSTPFLVLFIGLIIIPRGRLVEVGRKINARPPSASNLPHRLRLPVYATAGTLLLLLPHLVGSRITAWNQAVAQVSLFVSLHLLVRTSGQISLCHIGFAAVGAAGFGHSLSAGVPFVPALLIGVLACLPPALMICIPAIRLSGLYLALATLGFGILLSQYAYGKSFMFGSGVLVTPRPGVWGLTDDVRYYYVLLFVAAVSVGLVLSVERSRLGRLLRAMSDSPLALSTLGLSVNTSRVLVFCISCCLAGLSGAMFASLFGGASPDSFNYTQSFVALAVLAISGNRTVIAAIVAPILLYVVPSYLSNPDAAKVLQIGFGLAAVYAAAASTGRISEFHARMGTRYSDRRAGPASVRAADWVARPASLHQVRTRSRDVVAAASRPGP